MLLYKNKNSLNYIWFRIKTLTNIIKYTSVYTYTVNVNIFLLFTWYIILEIAYKKAMGYT